ncbi:MAG: DUF1134 domain-containing protein [Sphingomonadaceae bacterium]
MISFPPELGRIATSALGGLAIALAATSAAAQDVQTVDPNTMIDGDLVEQPGDAPVFDVPVYTMEDDGAGSAPAPAPSVDGIDQWSDTAYDIGSAANPDISSNVAPQWSDPTSAAIEASGDPAEAVAQNGTYKKDDLIGAAEGIFGKGAQGLASMIEGLLDKQGEPNGYIVGREGGGAFVLGARYGSGTLYHKVEGERPVYWTGPSIGLDAGANAGNAFILVYNLYDTEELYERYPQGEGQAYFVGGLNASYLRKGDVVLIPIRVGAGLRLGINAGYLKFSKKQRWLPF